MHNVDSATLTICRTINPVAFRTFTMLCSHHCYPAHPGRLHPKQEFRTHSTATSSTPLLGQGQPAFNLQFWLLCPFQVTHISRRASGTAQLVKNPPAVQETWVWSLGGRSPGEEKGYPLQDSGLENSMDCIDHGITKNWTRLSHFRFLFIL